MFSLLSLRQPTRRQVAQFAERQAGEPFSYQELGITASPPPESHGKSPSKSPRRWRVARFHGLLGHGQDDFEHAVNAIRAWRMFPASVSELSQPSAPIQSGEIVTPRLRALGLWILAACRIVYVIDERDEPQANAPARFGFAYGTLKAHPECGEERFLVEWRKEDDAVWYELTAVSRHNHLISYLAHPIVRWAQKRFSRRSVAAMQEAVAENRLAANESTECKT